MRRIDNEIMNTVVPVFLPGRGIPKIIHQTCKSKNLSDELLENIRKIKRLNPGWEYRLYDDNDIERFILNNYGENILNHYYRKISTEYGAARADLFRYLLIYKTGGVYLDIKSSITKPLESVIVGDDRLILSFWDNLEGEQHENWGYYREIKHIPRGEYQQWHIIAASGHPFIREVILQVLQNIERYDPYKVGVGLKGTLKTTGPIAYSLVMERMCKENAGFRLVDGAKEFGLKYSIYEDKFGCFHHKKVLESDYNRKITPIIDNGIEQGRWYRFYFLRIYNRHEKFVRKKEIIKREMQKYPNTLSFVAAYLKQRWQKRLLFIH